MIPQNIREHLTNLLERNVEIIFPSNPLFADAIILESYAAKPNGENTWKIDYSSDREYVTHLLFEQAQPFLNNYYIHSTFSITACRVVLNDYLYDKLAEKGKISR